MAAILTQLKTESDHTDWLSVETNEKEASFLNGCYPVLKRIS